MKVPARIRHRWHKLRTHVYVCLRCGCGKVNEIRQWGDRGEWVAVFHKSDGTSAEREGTPPCEVGVRTDRALAKYGLRKMEVAR